MSNVILDASALLALLNQEPGSDVVAAAMRDGAAISTINLAEVVAKLAEAGMPETRIRAALNPLPLELIPFDSELAFATGSLRPLTRAAGLSLGDRACLALGQRLKVPVLTTDAAWQNLALHVDVRLAR